ncbi:MAG: DUF362 domain-containing protein [Planctomycetota bacterium]|jgi:uncharacterized protein (DUF362 family)
MTRVAKVAFTDYETSIEDALDLIEAGSMLPQDGLIIIKPNLTNSSRPPVTTAVEAVEAVFQYCKGRSGARIAIGEGCGQGRTGDVFRALGYADLAKRESIELIDFNEAEAVLLENSGAFQLKELYMPKIALEAFIISVPVLKDHSFTGTTIAMKNMFGLPPARFYQGAWNKSKLHSPSTDKSVVDICLYKKPDLSVVDASTVLKGMHLAGTEERLGLILASFDPVAVDALGSELLGHDPRDLEYLTLADGVIGNMAGVEIVQG